MGFLVRGVEKIYCHARAVCGVRLQRDAARERFVSYPCVACCNGMGGLVGR